MQQLAEEKAYAVKELTELREQSGHLTAELKASVKQFKNAQATILQLEHQLDARLFQKHL